MKGDGNGMRLAVVTAVDIPLRFCELLTVNVCVLC